MDTSRNTSEKKQFRIFSLVIIALSVMLTLGCVLYQFRYYRTPVPADDSIYDYPTINSESEFIDIRWKNRDYDYLEGYISVDGAPVTAYPIHMVFYNDDGSYYRFPVKVRNYYTPEQEDEYAAKDLRGFIYQDREYITNTGEPTDRSWFYCLIGRDNILRNNYRIGFLIKIEGVTYFADTRVIYKYMDI